MNLFTLALVLAVVFGVGYVIDRTRRWVSSIDLSEPADDGPVPAGPQRTEPPPYEITRIVHRSGPEPEWGPNPVQYSGYRPAITESHSAVSAGSTGPIDTRRFDEQIDRVRKQILQIDRLRKQILEIDRVPKQILDIKSHERAIERLAQREDDRRRPDGEEHGRPEGGEEEGRTVGPGEVRGPDPIREIRFGRL